VALRAHAFMDLIPTGFWVFLLVQHGGENARQVEIGRRGDAHRPDVARFYRLFRMGLCAGLIGRDTGGEKVFSDAACPAKHANSQQPLTLMSHPPARKAPVLSLSKT
jgi:hypothetical protein